MNPFTALFCAALGANLLLQWQLIKRHIRHVHAHRDALPAAFRQRLSLENHRKAAAYTIARARVERLELLYGAALLLLWTLGGGFQALDGWWSAQTPSPLWTGVCFLLSALLLMGALDLPFALYRTFVVEQRFGFNRATPRTFVGDLVKQALLGAVIGGPFFALALWLMASGGTLWWLWVWGAWAALSATMLWLWPLAIAPLFNRFTPLEDETLARRVRALLERTGFAVKGLFVMDGSRRSGHGNAYFTGIGRNKRIVFFDTLLKSLNADETEAVLAHELGHFHHRHLRSRMLVSLLLGGAGLALLGWLSGAPAFYHGLGVATPSNHAALALFFVVAPLFTLFLQPLFARASRRHEQQADAFAVRHADGAALVSALVALYRDNASTLTPDPLYSAFHDSHPPAAQRIAYIEGLGG